MPPFTELGAFFSTYQSRFNSPRQSRYYSPASPGSSLGEPPVLNWNCFCSPVIGAGGSSKGLGVCASGFCDKERPNCTFWRGLVLKNLAPRICRLDHEKGSKHAELQFPRMVWPSRCDGECIGQQGRGLHTNRKHSP